MEQMISGRPTIGMLINQMDGRYQAPLWQGVADAAEALDVNLIFFVGKSIHSPYVLEGSEEDLHNIVYELVDVQKLDGLILSSGSLANFIGPDEFSKFCKIYRALPMVSIALEIKGMPSVVVENREGVRKIVSHLINHHHYKKIAFIKGPATNPEANERYLGYLEALNEGGIAVDEQLIVEGNFGEISGEEAVQTLLDDRKVSFDAVCAANDDMALGAYWAFSKRGIRIPEDVAMTGFDDIEEIRFYDTSITSVSQPFYEQGRKAFEALLDLIKGESVPNKILIQTNPVFRRSCGCDSFKVDSKGSARESITLDIIDSPLKKEKDAIIDKTLEVFSPSSEKKKEYYPKMLALMEDLISDIKQQKIEGEFSGNLVKMLMNEIVPIIELYFWQECLTVLREKALGKITNANEYVLASEIFSYASLRVDFIIKKSEARNRIALQRSLWYLRRFNGSIANIFNKSDLIQAITMELPNIDIPSCFIAMFDEQGLIKRKDYSWSLPSLSRIEMAYMKDNKINLTDSPKSVLTIHVIRQLLEMVNRRVVFVVQPLLTLNNHFGFLVCEMGPRDEIVYGMLREQISNALHTVQLFEIKESAENKLKDALQELSKSEERFKEMAVFLPTVIIETDMNLTIQFINQAGYKVLGLNEDTQVNQYSLRDFVAADDISKLNSYCIRILEGGTNNYNEIKIQDHSNNLVTLYCKATPVSINGAVKGIRWNAIDIKSLIDSMVVSEDSIFDKFDLTPREESTLHLMLQGYRNREIGEKLFIAESTVKVYVSSIYTKLGVKNRDEFFGLLKDYNITRFGYESFIFSFLRKLFEK